MARLVLTIDRDLASEAMSVAIMAKHAAFASLERMAGNAYAADLRVSLREDIARAEAVIGGLKAAMRLQNVRLEDDAAEAQRRAAA